jgi:hypothetical protein
MVIPIGVKGEGSRQDRSDAGASERLLSSRASSSFSPFTLYQIREALVPQVLEVPRGQLHHFRRCCRLVGKQEAVFPRFLLRIVSLRDRFGVPIEYDQFDLTSGRIASP